MRNLTKHVHVLALTLATVIIPGVRAADPTVVAVQSSRQEGSGSLPGQEIGDGRQANPDFCTYCYRRLQTDNRDCESLKGQDWQVCREAASTAYHQCSQGC